MARTSPFNEQKRDPTLHPVKGRWSQNSQRHIHIDEHVKSSTINLLIVSHFLVSGASDDAVSCAVMLEVLYLFSQADAPFQHAVIFSFNGAEENLLQVSRNWWSNSVNKKRRRGHFRGTHFAIPWSPRKSDQEWGGRPSSLHRSLSLEGASLSDWSVPLKCTAWSEHTLALVRISNLPYLKSLGAYGKILSKPGVTLSPVTGRALDGCQDDASFSSEQFTLDKRVLFDADRRSDLPKELR